MWNRLNFFLLLIFFAISSSNHYSSLTADCGIKPTPSKTNSSSCLCINNNTLLQSHELLFEKADPAIREYLVNFAIESNDIYQTRTASVDVAKEVFAISDSVFREGVVEILKLDGEIVGFYTLKVHPPSDDWFEHELGHLFVKAGLQGRGFGTLLFRRAVALAQSKGWDKLEWLCDPDAEIFYLKMGATITGHCENFLNPSVDLPIFEYNL